MRLCDRRAVRGVEDAGRSGSGSHRHRPLNAGFVERKNLRRRRADNQAENDDARVVEGNVQNRDTVLVDPSDAPVAKVLMVSALVRCATLDRHLRSSRRGTRHRSGWAEVDSMC